MAKQTRRGFLRQATVGVASAGVITTLAACAPNTADASSMTATGAAETNGSTTLLNSQLPEGPIIAHIHNASNGEISILFGTREIVYRDSDIVARLLKALH
jgi:hypothetical protein